MTRSVAHRIHVPDGAKFSCESCGRCCTGWTIPVEQAAYDRLQAHDWDGQPFERFERDGHPYRIRLVDDGRCFFLDGNRRCRIHSELSYDVKPAACRAFPLAVMEMDGRRYGRLSYWCPAVAANRGKPLERQSGWLNDVARHSDCRIGPLKVSPLVGISGGDFELLHDCLRRFLVAPDLRIEERLAAGSGLLARLESAARSGRPDPANSVIDVAETAGPGILAEETRRKGRRAAARRVLSLFLLQDRLPGRVSLLSRFVSIAAFNAGVRRLDFRAVPSKASWRQLRRVRFDPSAEAANLLARYVNGKLESRRYVVGDLTLVAGFNLLAAAYGMVSLVARARAVSGGRDSCSDDDVADGIGVADLLVVEHTAVNQGRLQRRLVEHALGDPALCGGISRLLAQ